MSPFLFSSTANSSLYILRKTWLFLLLPLIIIISACNKKNTDTGEYSKAFVPVFNETSRLFDLNKPNLALHYLDSAFKKLDKPYTNDKFRFYGLHYVYCKKVTHNRKQALKYADSMLMQAQKSVDVQQHITNFAEANYAKGDAYFSLSQFNDAYQCYFQGYLIGKKYLNKTSTADYTYRMGMIMYKQAHYNIAANYFKDSYRESLLMKGPDNFSAFYRKQELLDNIGESYIYTGDIDSAITYFDKALKYNIKFKARSNMLEIARAVIYNNKGEALMIMGEHEQAEQLLKKSIAINAKKGGDNGDAELAGIKLGKIYLATNKNDLLINLLGNLRTQLDSVKNEDAEADWNHLMGNYHLRKNNLSKALIYIQRYNSLKDSTIKRLSTLKESDVNQQLANFEKQYQIENLSNNNKQQRKYLYAAIVCALMAVCIILLILRNWRISKLDVATVRVLNREISEQKITLEKALEEIKNSSREKDRILRTVAHDLRNPLGGIASLSNIMVEETEDNDLKYQLKIIKDTSSDTLELINEILEATNNNTSAGFNKQLVEINSLLNNSIELLRFKAAEKHQHIVFDGLENSGELLINREMIWRVISNLITNAIKFSPVDASIHVKLSQKENHVQISINDHGIGIPDDMKDKVFNMFTDAKRPGTIGEKSFGLGLSICKQIIEKHNGKIWFESDLKKGTTFYVKLPKPKKADFLIMDTELKESVSR
jgi:signal transduction histidine kinase